MKNEKLVKFKELPLTLQYLTKKILESDSGMYFMETPEKILLNYLIITAFLMIV